MEYVHIRARKRLLGNGAPSFKLKSSYSYRLKAVDPLFVQFIFVQLVFVQPCFRPTLDSSNSLSSMTYIRPICFRPILVHFLFLSKKKQKLDFIQYLGLFPIKDMQTPPPPSVLIRFSWMNGSVLYSMGKIMRKISDLHFSSYHQKLG